jgi:hypothetical protein
MMRESPKFQGKERIKYMSNRFLVLIIFLLVSSLLLPVNAANAQAERTEFTGWEVCDAETLSAMRLWMAGPNFQVRGWSETAYETASIAQMTGTTYIYDGLAIIGKNYIVNAKFRMETDEGGVWVGVSRKAADSPTITSIGHGEGIYEGLEFRLYQNMCTEGGQPFHGYIIDHRR